MLLWLQKKYLDKIITKIKKYEYLYIPNDCSPHDLKEKFPNFKDNNEAYVKCTIGVRNMNKKDDSLIYFNYIFSGQFFRDLLEISK